MSGKDCFYWDSCIFIAHITDEPRPDPLELLGTKEQVSLFDLGQIDLATSTITITEVLRTNIQPDEYLKFRLLFSRRNFHLLDVTKRIAEISHDIRDFYRLPNGATLSTPDCIHVATAIDFQCRIMYTFDGDGNRPGLLSLDSPISNKYNLRLMKPHPTMQPQLPLDL